jgi:hypothetical protein
MPRLHVIGRDFEMSDEAAAPLIAADILHWDTMGGVDGDEPPHLHINPELPDFGHIEADVREHGPRALPDAR